MSTGSGSGGGSRSRGWGNRHRSHSLGDLRFLLMSSVSPVSPVLFVALAALVVIRGNGGIGRAIFSKGILPKVDMKRKEKK